MDNINALDVANYFIEKAQTTYDDVSHMKLHKLLYYAQGYYLANKNKPLFNLDISKWDYGPVVPFVYKKFMQIGGGPRLKPHPEGEPSRLPKEIQVFLDEIWQTYGKFTGLQMSDMSHQEAPWLETEMYRTIDPEKIKDYFKGIIYSGQSAACI